ncbi:ATP-dependent Zn protease ['Chrysanthemum coronarium' phytoplasma]|uniref:ATP-dependent Zn protease n=1 Tax='Chrysanthemum coronarium' phytoplasma TaxID=1520703 RepID=A0ABQ0J2W7_9MOLU|nr:ATP-dependent Zn protease ['Chrysanthemum coronarium' phytoplasma]
MNTTKKTNLLRVLFGPIVYLHSMIFIFYIIHGLRRNSGKLKSNSKISSSQKSLFSFKNVAGNE